MSGDEWKDSDVEPPTVMQVRNHIAAKSRLLVAIHANDDRTLGEAFLSEISPCGEFVQVTQTCGFGLFGNWTERNNIRVMAVLNPKPKRQCKFEPCQ